jgi:uncharacterized protein (UPF0333 family)
MGKVFRKVGQSTLEYVIVLTAIVAAILFAVTQFVKPGVNRVYSEVGNRMNQSGVMFSNQIGGGVSMPTSSTTSGSSTTTGSTTTGSTTTGF